MSLSGKCHTLTYEEAVVLYGFTVGADPQPEEEKEVKSLLKKGLVHAIEIETEGKPFRIQYGPKGEISRESAERLVSRAAAIRQRLEINGKPVTAYLQTSVAGRDCLSLPPKVSECFRKSGVYVEDAPSKIFEKYTPDWAAHKAFQKCWRQVEVTKK